jgi:uridine kinase
VASRTPRDALLERLAGLITQRRPAQTLRVAVDGPDAAGKTTLAGELAGRLAGKRDVIRASIDGFHRPRAERYRRGDLSPEGAYHDTFDYDAVRAVLLDPLGPGGSRRYRTAVFDHRSDAPAGPPPRLAPAAAVLLFDGVFLLRPQLRDGWDIAIFVDADPDEVLRRALVRDTQLMGAPDRIRERYRRRYLPAQRLYRADASPEASADVVIDNTDPVRPRVVKWPAQAPETP